MKLNGVDYKDWRTAKGRIEEELYAFLEEWFNENSYVIGHTSGSTGTPKEIRLNKADMCASAEVTNSFFGIGQDSVLLLCLSVSYIAGKMMVVRALEANAELITAKVSAHPLKSSMMAGKLISLAALVPMQVEETLKHPEEKVRLADIRQLLIGGASVSPELEEQLKSIQTTCYATYGMTETVSHVALRKLNDDTIYRALGMVSFETDERGCLIIHAPHLQERLFVTNDLVRLENSIGFEWLGRLDNVINSGGIKFFPEVIERKIETCINARFFIASEPDERLGQRIVLVIEGDASKMVAVDVLYYKLRKHLDSYEMPKNILFCKHFRETASGKIIRDIAGTVSGVNA